MSTAGAGGWVELVATSRNSRGPVSCLGTVLQPAGRSESAWGSRCRSAGQAFGFVASLGSLSGRCSHLKRVLVRVGTTLTRRFVVPLLVAGYPTLQGVQSARHEVAGCLASPVPIPPSSFKAVLIFPCLNSTNPSGRCCNVRGRTCRSAILIGRRPATVRSFSASL